MLDLSTMTGPAPARETDRAPAEGRVARPAILTIDDDPSVSRAVARDLRRKYGERYRIVRAESGPQALDALKEIKLRGEEVAVLLADYRMPEMSGIEFLEQAMDLFPLARRVLLTAYADTDAAIQAINVVDLDHYLLKPWDPPEEKLYPVVDELLAAWTAVDHRPAREIRVVGHRWSARSYEVRDFLARNSVPYRWFLADEPEGERLLAAAGQDGAKLPVVVTEDGEPMVEPTDAELAARVGLPTTPSTDFYDLVVVGGGPAGLGAAVYGGSEGLRTVLVERRATGGQAGQSSRIENYLGFPDGVSGEQLAERARRQALKFEVEMLTARKVTALEQRGSARVVRFEDGSELSAHTVILATGRVVPEAGGPRPGRARRSRRLLRRRHHRGAQLPQPGRVRRRRGQLGRSGRDVLLPVRPEGRAGGPRPLAGRVDVALSHRPGREGREHRGPLLHRDRRGRRRRSPGDDDAPGQRHRGDRDGQVVVAVLLHRRRPADRVAGRHAGPRRARLRAGRAGPARRRPPAGRLAAWSATRTTWRPASPASSWPATSAPTRSSGSPPRSARARWP